MTTSAAWDTLATASQATSNSVQGHMPYASFSSQGRDRRSVPSMSADYGDGRNTA
jgi:hypothetical protein